MARMISRGYSRSTWTTGSLGASSALADCSRAARKTGDSSIETRIQRPTPTSTALSRNGMRQPQDSNCWSVVSAETNARTATARRLPAGAPACGQEAQYPRRSGVPYSAAISTAPPHSPPRAKPCTSRRTISRIGAQTPTVA